MFKQTLILTGALVCGLLTFAPGARAQGTAFTYQGRLNDGPNPANGFYDLTFALFSGSSGPGQLGLTQTNLATEVSDGRFTVRLDFGASFAGADRWLETGVRTNGSGPFATLSPRQQLTPTPYAIYAPNAGTATSAVTLTGTLPDTQLSANVALRAGGNSFTGNQDISSGNLTLGSGKLGVGTANPVAKLEVAGAVKATSFVGDGSALTGISSGQVADNSITAAKLASDAASLTKVSAGAMASAAGNVGVGTTSPQAKLDVNGNAQVSGYLAIDFQERNVAGLVPGLVFGNGGGGGIAYHQAPGDNQYELDFYTRWEPRLSITQNGNVGIGATSPQSSLQVNGGIRARGGKPGPVGANNNGYAFGVPGDNDSGMFSSADGQLEFYANALERMRIMPNGNLGIGTTDPQAKLDVNGSVAVAGTLALPASANVEVGVITIGGTPALGMCGDNNSFVGGSGNFTMSGGHNTANGNAALSLNTTGSLNIAVGHGAGANLTTGHNNIDIGNQGVAGEANTIRIGTDGTHTKAYLSGDVYARSFTPPSDRNAKADFEAVEPGAVLQKVAGLPISTWRFKQDGDTRHIGPMAQDFYAAFGVGPDDKHIATVDADGVALAAIQGLNEKLEVRSQKSASRNYRRRMRR